MPIHFASRVRTRPLALALIGAIAGSVALAGCAVGPNFRTPDAPPVAAYTPDKLPDTTTATDAPTGDAQSFLEGAAVPEHWWKTFVSEELDRRVDQALTNSPTIASAQASLRQAEENVNAARGSFFPSLDANVGAQRGNANFFGQLAPGQSIFNVYNAGVNVNYTLDLFGGIRRGVEAQSAVENFQQYQLEGTYLTLAANVVTTSFREASLRGQIQATEEIIGVYRQQLDLVERQHEIGAKSLADVLVIRTQVATVSAQLPALRQQLLQTQTQLAVYLGQFPAQSELAAVDLDTLTLPTDVPVTVPSELARQRPGHPRRRSAAASGDRRSRRSHGEPLSADLAERQLRLASVAHRRSVRGRHESVEPRRGLAAAAVPRRHVARSEARG